MLPGTGRYGDSFIYDEMQINSHKKQALSKVLIEACGNKHLHTLLEALDQGRAFHIISKDATSNLIFQRLQIHPQSKTQSSSYKVSGEESATNAAGVFYVSINMYIMVIYFLIRPVSSTRGTRSQFTFYFVNNSAGVGGDIIIVWGTSSFSFRSRLELFGQL